MIRCMKESSGDGEKRRKNMKKRILPNSGKHRKKIGEWMVAVGFMGFLFFVSGIDGPGNDVRVIYIMIAISMTVTIIGVAIADFWG